MMEQMNDHKGKGKAIDWIPPAMNENGDGISSEELSEDALAEAVNSYGKRQRFSTRFEDCRGVKVFERELRTGRL